MLIANPIYDTVFKYLLEDIEIAKGIISNLLKVTIIELDVKPQETSSEITFNNAPITVYRLDFKALIVTETGKRKKILIELQKTKRDADIMRFRRYLAENYQKQEDIIIYGKQISMALPIITVYFLGFKLDHIFVPILKIDTCFVDVAKNEILKEKPEEPFVDLLTHQSYTIQIPRLNEENQTEIENILSVFNQKYAQDDRHQLDYLGVSTNPITRKIVDRLNRAIADGSLRKKMDLEDEVERSFTKGYSELVDLLDESRKELEENKNQLEENKNQLEENKNQLEENKNQLEEKDLQLELLRREIEQLKRSLKE
jgi:hypothetical protein